MKVFDIFGASASAALAVAIFVGIFSIKDFGVSFLYFSIFAFFIAFFCSLAASYPLFVVRSNYSHKTFVITLLLVGFFCGMGVYGFLTRGRGFEWMTLRIVFFYGMCGSIGALAALGYLSKRGI